MELVQRNQFKPVCAATAKTKRNQKTDAEPIARDLKISVELWVIAMMWISRDCCWMNSNSTSVAVLLATTEVWKSLNSTQSTKLVGRRRRCRRLRLLNAASLLKMMRRVLMLHAEEEEGDEQEEEEERRRRSRGGVTSRRRAKRSRSISWRDGKRRAQNRKIVKIEGAERMLWLQERRENVPTLLFLLFPISNWRWASPSSTASLNIQQPS